MPYIKSISVNLFDGKFNQVISLEKNLNILSGVNGTGKTKILQLLKQGQGVLIDPPEVKIGQMKILALSPKRNAEKRAQAVLLSIIRNTNLSQKSQELLAKQIRDENYDSYPSFAELLLLNFERLRSQNFKTKIQQQTLDEFINELNQQVVSLTLPGYQIKGKWDQESQALVIKVFKESINGVVNLEHLSTGEQELLSLVFNIYLMKDDIDVYLIDEPEIHLNWTLERNLFDFLRKFSETHNKQVVVTTHSRIIFDPEFQQFVIYLIWDKGEIKVKTNVPKEYKEKIAGETTQLMNILTPSKKTIFVEDNEHELTIRLLLKIFKKNEDAVEIMKLGSAGNIENLYRSTKPHPQYSNAWFLRDGDNQQSTPQDRFIKLQKYSIENYYLNPRVIEALSEVKENEVKNKLVAVLKKNSGRLTGKTKNSLFFQELIQKLNANDLSLKSLDNLDCSGILDDFIQSINFQTRKEFMERYLEKASELGLVEDIFDTELISFIKSI